MKLRRPGLILILTTVLFWLCACQGTEPVNADNAMAPADVIRGYPIIFKQVYCTGENNDTPVRYSYIELFNTSDKPVSLDGLYLGYAKGDRDKFAPYPLPEDAVIAPHASYLIRGAQAVGENGELYIDACEKFTLSHYDADLPNLRLSSKRCRLILTDSPNAVKQSELRSGTVLAYFGAYRADAGEPFPYPANSDALDKHTAVLRTEDNSAWLTVDYTEQNCFTVTDYTPSSSQGKLTDIPLSAIEVTASVTGGRYTDDVTVTLSTLPGYDIVYTRDCAKSPRAFDIYSGADIRITDTTAEQYGYTASLLMDKYGSNVKPRTLPTIAASVLRACVTDGKSFGPVMTETYFVQENMSDYDDILLMNITLDPDDFTGKDGIYAVISDDIFANRPPCDGYMEIFDPAGQNPDDHYVRLTMNGNGSLAFYQKSMRVSVREPSTVESGGTLEYDLFAGEAVNDADIPITAFDTFVLRNSGNDVSCAHFRDALMQKLSVKLNVCTQAYRPSLLFINGELWGLYNLRERYSTDYFYRHFGLLPENLVMLESISPLLTGSWNTKYELNEGAPGDEEDFYALIDYAASHNMKEDAHLEWIEDRMDLDNYIDFFIASCYLANTDWPGNNIKVWRNKNPDDPSGLDTRWRWVLSDMDFGIGHSTSANQPMFTHALTEDTVCGKLMVNLLKNNAFRLRFADRACMLVNEIYQKDAMLTELDRFADTIEPYMDLNFKRWRGDGGSMDRWKDHVRAAEHFLSGRTKYFIREMQDKLKVTLDLFSCETDGHADVSITTEPATAGIPDYCITDRPMDDTPLYFRDSTAVTIRAVPHDGYRVTGFVCNIGPREETVSGDTLRIELYAKCTITVLTEKTNP